MSKRSMPATIINILVFEDEIQVHWENDIEQSVISDIMKDAFEAVKEQTEK